MTFQLNMNLATFHKLAAEVDDFSDPFSSVRYGVTTVTPEEPFKLYSSKKLLHPTCWKLGCTEVIHGDNLEDLSIIRGLIKYNPYTRRSSLLAASSIAPFTTVVMQVYFIYHSEDPRVEPGVQSVQGRTCNKVTTLKIGWYHTNPSTELTDKRCYGWSVGTSNYKEEE